jgi:hypothetical protein
MMRGTGEELPMEHQAVYERLVQAARARELVHYGDLAKMLGIDMDNPHFGALVGKVLGQISEDEVAAGRPMISAIVVSKDTMLPGYGFFTLGQQLHLVEPGEDDLAFAIRQIRRVHDYWAMEGQPTGESLTVLLERARAASPNDRIDFRDAIAAHGEAAISAMVEWIDHPELWRFATKVLWRVAQSTDRDAAIEALRAAGAAASSDRRAAIDGELAALGAPATVRSGSYGPIDDEAIRRRLIAAARQRQTVSYKDLAKATGREMKGPNWAVHIGRILGRISSEEAHAGRPLLSVIVVSQDTKRPGGGFYNLGKELGLLQPGETEDRFIDRQTERVYDYWQAEGRGTQ